MILDDKVFLDEIINKISSDSITVEHAVSHVSNNYIDMFESMDDEYFRERVTDIKDICQRIVNNILGISIRTLTDIDEEVIVVAKDLTPSDTAQIDKNRVIAFATDMGGRTSHTAIMARSLEILAVVGLADISQKVKEGDMLIVDGNEGIVIINPDEDRISEYNKLMLDYKNECNELKQLKNIPETTINGISKCLAFGKIGKIFIYPSDFLLKRLVSFRNEVCRT